MPANGRRDLIRRLKVNGLKTAIPAYIRNISQVYLQKVFANKLKRVQACTDSRVHHFQHLLSVHSVFPNALYEGKVALPASTVADSTAAAYEIFLSSKLKSPIPAAAPPKA